MSISLRRSCVVLTRHEHRVIDVHVAAPEGAFVATPGPQMRYTHSGRLRLVCGAIAQGCPMCRWVVGSRR